MGEPAGIGPEVTIRAWEAREFEQLQPFFVIGPPTLYAQRAAMLGIDLPIIEIQSPEEANTHFEKALPILAIDGPETIVGSPRRETADSVIRSIDDAVRMATEGNARAVVTNPIHKATLMEVGFVHPGHTDYLASLSKSGLGDDAGVLMLLAIPGLRVAPLIVHEPLARVASLITADSIVKAGRVLARALEGDFGIAKPRIAVAGLNPHAGESGHLGTEEETEIIPAIAKLINEGVNARGPFASDTLFHANARKSYDAALCMYHDQALIPLKTLNFHGGVNITLGLPFVRTSPDHGTALDIAADGKANPRSLCAALRTAGEIADQRRNEAGA